MNCNLRLILLPALLGMAPAAAQRTLTLEECREMAVEASRELDQARTQVEMAGYDRKIARANYFPNISATGAYLHNNRNLSLLPLNISEGLTGMGAAAQARYDASLQQIRQLLSSEPQVAALLMNDPKFVSLMQLLSMELHQGSRVNVEVEGPDEEQVANRLVELLETHFDFPPLG